MSEKNWHKFPLLFSLYIAQSIPMSFFSTVVPVIMRQENFSLQAIGLLQLVKLPWIFKFLWAPIIDNNARTTKELKRWVFISELFYALVIFSIAFLNLQSDFGLIIFLVIVAFIVSGTQDIAVDIYAILSLKSSERSLGNSMQSGGSFVGSFLGTGVLLVAYHYVGWSKVLFLLALFVLLAVVPLYFSGSEIAADNKTKERVSMKDILSFFKQQGQWQQISVLIFYYSGIIGIMTMLKPYLVDLGYNVKEIAFMSGIFGTLTAALATLLGALFMRKVSRKVSLFTFLFLTLIASIYFKILSGIVPSIAQLYMGIGLIWSAYGFSTVAIYTLAMDTVRKGREGTDFTIQIVITHLCSLLVATASGKIAHEFGYSGLFSFEVLITLFTFLILMYSLRNKSLKIKN
ncbi:MAG: MFS transporter [Porphyromonadaceae bacterium CG2_30_38_12]|nr:MAG: MFS transporter [Porphyromonadaceae bacterium CG2_30_38_12]